MYPTPGYMSLDFGQQTFLLKVDIQILFFDQQLIISAHVN